ncbi:hypothetical protein V2I52_23790 [Brenneria sp. g21c3]|uniref:hypothetical protein n=1 Tax=Brenneria sp. g21c3 TaxID=3093893 RepID=UPI002E9DB5FA|nr:hypothetical protein [Brenneria sp. g21c3]
MAREKRAQAILEKRYGKENVLSESCLRDSTGRSVKDPLMGKKRRKNTRRRWFFYEKQKYWRVNTA